MTRCTPPDPYAESLEWRPAAPRWRLRQSVVSLLVAAVAVWVAAAVLPGVHINSFEGAVLAAAAVGVLNAVLPPVVAALRLPYTLVLGFLAVLAHRRRDPVVGIRCGPEGLQGRLVRLGACSQRC